MRGFGCRGAISTALLTALLVALFASSSEAKPRCHGHKATIVGGGGANRLHGTAGPDVIVGGGGRDRIDGRGGFDLICAGGGDDVVLGGPGGDTVLGGSGDDALYGGLQDDKLIGGKGNDLLIGGEAYNTLLGGPGDDYNREGFTVNGGPGSDWLSFATNTWGLAHYGLTLGTYENRRQSNLENLVGSRFVDVIYGGPAAAAGTVRSLGSRAGSVVPAVQDECYDFAITQCDGPFAGPDQPIVVADPVGPDPGVTVFGGPASERYSISQTGRGVRVDGPLGVSAGPGCTAVGGGTISCDIPGRLGYVVAFGMEGDDTITIDGHLNRRTEAVMDGGEGGDTLRGGAEDDQLIAGDETVVDTGKPYPPDTVLPSPDTLIGGGGDDSLMAGSMGPDRLYGGRGTDQLATWSACSGGVFDGGPGRSDIADFVFAGEVHARLGGVAVDPNVKWFDPCTGPIHLANSTEDLEGGRNDDVLIGNRRGNFIAGHEGDDVIKGMGGNDNLVGEGGHDRLVGGAGSDHLDCGADGGVARRDAKDPRPRGCH